MVAAVLLRHFGKMQHNFQSIMLFSIVLSGCMSGICIYGIMKQFDSTQLIREVNTLSLISLCLAAILSIGSSAMPTVVHSPAYKARVTKRKAFTSYLGDAFARYWNVGSSGFLIIAIAGVFIVGALSFIPVAVGIVAYLTFIFVMAAKHAKEGIEREIYDSIDA